MGDLVLFLPVVAVLAVCFVAAFVVAKAKSEAPGSTKNQSRAVGKGHGYSREVDSIHITTDAATERRRRLDQLKSLYDSGMMEKDEYLERCASVEDDFRGNYRR